ncbi:hypothetical protein TWF694_004315 [Orbilia ellipsospora]|uniref:Uncharacterized protein n=1 Tax=Orbilia ellipsospora TaxID=2528407 RepID=A0AAV9WYL8_9PEZI
MATRLTRFAQVAAVAKTWHRIPTVASSSPRNLNAIRSFSSPSGAGSGATSSAPPSEKKTSPHVSYYKIYGRAFSKILLMSLLVYQGIYYGWMWLEHLETKSVKEGMNTCDI